MRVLVLSRLYPNPVQPTRGIFVHRQVEALQRKGAQMLVVSPIPRAPLGGGRFGNYRLYSRVPPRSVLDGVPVLHPRFLQPPRNWFSGAAVLLFARSVATAVLRLTQDFRPDLIHAHMATPDGYAATVLSDRLGVPVVCSLRGSDINVAPHRGRLIRRLTVLALSRATRVTAVSGALRDAARRLQGRPIDVVYTGLDENRFRPDPSARARIRSQFGLDEGCRLFGFVGNLYREKGVHALLDMLMEVLRTGQKAELLLVGDGPERTTLERRAQLMGVRERVHFTGRVSNEEVAGFLNAMDVVVLASEREGLPNVLVEALACGRPVVATAVGGISELVEHDRTGVLVRAGDSVELASACSRLAADDELRAVLSQNGTRVVQQRFSWERNAAAIMRTYEMALGDWQQGAAT